MNWTAAQEKFITVRNKDVLVSAAAGSGKTAVLVARVLALLTDPVSPRDIDRLLIVTFTKAAAGELRERIASAIEDALAKAPDDPHLQKQTMLIHNAQVTTIDGFCSMVLRSYGSTIALEGGFRVGDEGEMTLLREDVLASLFEEEHEKASPEFLRFVETFAPGKSEQPLSELIRKLSETALASPDPKGFLVRLAGELAEEENEDSATSFMTSFLEEVHMLVAEAMSLAWENLSVAKSEIGPSAYVPAAEGDVKFFQAMQEAAGDYAALRHALLSGEVVRLSGAKPKAGEDEALRGPFKERRERIRKIRETLGEEYLRYDLETVRMMERETAAPLRTLVSLTEQYLAMFAKEKRERNLVDFSDLEQLALLILRDENGAPTEAAKELAAQFDEVMIDEYQDSNYLQEALLTSVCGRKDGSPNYSNVGDVKQSIYRFRQARPDLFMRKYDTYKMGTDDTDNEGETENAHTLRIDLDQNFRSRHEVTDAVNLLFRQIMRKEIGGIAYGDAESLKAGADYPEVGQERDHLQCDTECMIVYTEEEEILDETDAASQIELEMRAIGARIREMVGKQMIYDPKEGGMRKIAYRDIVVLFRSMSATATIADRTLSAMGIPVHSVQQRGYFSAQEVQLILSYLKILDNPRQDIPLAAVLRSQVAALSASDLAAIKVETGDLENLWDRILAYKDEGKEAAIRESIDAFLADYNAFRAQVADTPIHTLIFRIMEETGLEDYFAALPDGLQRSANLHMLIEKARAYEETSYTGLYHFVRYIDHLREYDIDFGEAGTIGESEDVVRIMTIHKSKGLEYPIVFVAGLSRKFNLQDLNASVLMHPEYGLASDYIDPERRIRAKSLKKLSLRRRLLLESLGEELRVLYVAMTRAKQKLILSMCIKDREKLQGMRLMLPDREVQLPEAYLQGVVDYRSFIIPAILRQSASGVQEAMNMTITDDAPLIRIREVLPSALVGEELAQHAGGELLYRKLLTKDAAYIDAALADEISGRFAFRYPYEGRIHMPGKVSVSELKMRAQTDEESVELYEELPVIPYIPDFMKTEKEQVSGAGRGTLYHRFMELLQYDHLPQGNATQRLAAADKESAKDHKELSAEIKEALKVQLAHLTEQGMFSEEEASVIDLYAIAAFLSTELGRRMHTAALSGKLYREQPFTISVPADRIDPSYPSAEEILVQGIIDAYFYEDASETMREHSGKDLSDAQTTFGECKKEGIVLVDYKTDRAARGAEGELAARYKTQIDTYAEALSRLSGTPVAEKYLYSFALGKALSIT